MRAGRHRSRPPSLAGLWLLVILSMLAMLALAAYLHASTGGAP